MRCAPGGPEVGARAAWGWLLPAVVAAATGCESRIDVVALEQTSSPGDAGDAGDVGDASVVDADDDGDAGAACDYAAVTAVSRAGERTLDELAGGVRVRALCTCGDLSSSAPLRVQGALAPDELAVGVDGSARLSVDSVVDGDLWVAGAEGLALGEGRLDVGGGLRVGGDVLGADADVVVAGDMGVGGRIQLASLEVGGSLRQPEAATLDLTSGGAAPAPIERGAVEVLPACPCDDESRSEPSRWDALGTSDGSSLSLPGPCSRTRIAELGFEPVVVELPHGGLVVVEGDLAIDGDLVLAVADGHTLDLLVGGNLRVDGRLQLGGSLSDPQSGGEVRLFLAGGGTVDLRGGGTLKGLLHAPDAELVLPAPLEVYGSLLVRRVAAEALLHVEP